MKKLLKIKRIFTILLIFLFSINGFAAVVSDNDGSAFVTKAEFDALKNNFAKQINDYNESIDKKIDGSIAQYLEGLKLQDTWNLKTLFNAFNIPTITSKRNSDIVWSEDLQGWNFKTAYYSYLNGSSNQYEASKGGTVAWKIASEAGKRGLYTEELVGGTTAYRWSGYTTNFKQTNDAEMVIGRQNEDTGYATNRDAQYLLGWMYEDTTATEKSKVELAATKEYIYLNDSASASSKPITPAYSLIFSSSYSYTKGDEYSFIYRDPTAANSTAKKLRKEKDNKYWARGSTSNFTQSSIWTNKAVMDATNCKIYVDLINGAYGNGQFKDMPIQKKADYTKFSCGAKGQMITSPLEAFKSDVTWKNIMHQDTSQYNYKDDTVDKSLSNYSMLNGIPLLIVEKNHRYTWTVKFSETANINVYLKYGVFDGDGTPVEANCIKVSATEGGTKTNYATISGGSGKIYFDTEKNGIVFVKWRLASDTNGGGTLDVTNSAIINDKKIDD